MDLHDLQVHAVRHVQFQAQPADCCQPSSNASVSQSSRALAALRAERSQRKGYAAELEAAAQSCQ